MVNEGQIGQIFGMIKFKIWGQNASLSKLWKMIEATILWGFLVMVLLKH